MKLKSTDLLFGSLKQKRWQYAILGILLSFIGPAGELLFVKIFSGLVKDSFFLTLIYAEFLTLFLLSLFGYFFGKHVEKIEQLAFRDKLTGLYNRHYLIEQLNELIASQRRYQKTFALIMLDLDHFKKVNDSYGHSIGDKTLKAVATCITEEIRETDFGSRFGGEEFIIVCPHTSVNDCFKLAERIRISIEGISSEKLGFPGTQTISAGVYEVCSDQDVSLPQILNNVDKALYEAKEDGRNRVVIYRAQSK